MGKYILGSVQRKTWSSGGQRNDMILSIELMDAQIAL